MTSGFARLTGPVTLAGRTAQSRVMFGPHETNLGAASGGQHGLASTGASLACRAAGGSRPGTSPTTSAARPAGPG